MTLKKALAVAKTAQKIYRKNEYLKIIMTDNDGFRNSGAEVRFHKGLQCIQGVPASYSIAK